MEKETTAAAKKKSPSSKASNPSSSTLHPPYFQMISEAISSLKDRTGSSQPAIAKFIQEKYEKQLAPNFKKMLSIQLKKFVKSEKLVKVKNSYKISATQKSKSVVAPAQITSKGRSSAAKKVLEKAVKMKRLSQVKTPEALKKKSTISSAKKIAENVKKLNKGKNPEAKKKKVVVKRKESKPSKPAPKKAKN